VKTQRSTTKPTVQKFVRGHWAMRPILIVANKKAGGKTPGATFKVLEFSKKFLCLDFSNL